MSEVFYTAAEAAERLGVSKVTVIRWIELGQFPGAHKSNPALKNSPWRIAAKTVADFETARRDHTEDRQRTIN